MLRKLLLITICATISAGLAACSSTQSPNANTQANIPPEFAGNVVVTPGNSTPGIPDANTINANNVPKGGTPTPGIPDPANIGKPIKGTTPTPGIPDAETLKRQANTIIKDVNLVNNPANVKHDQSVKKPGDRLKPNQ